MVRRALVGTLTVSFLASFTVALAALFAGEPYTDPLAPYEQLKPGAPDTVLEGFPCTYYAMMPYPGESSVYCHIGNPHAGITSIAVLTRDNTLQRVSFTVQNTQLGHLVRHYSRPDAIRRRKSVSIVCWDEGVIAVARPTGRLSYHSAVTYFALASPAAAAYEQEFSSGYCHNFRRAGS